MFLGGAVFGSVLTAGAILVLASGIAEAALNALMYLTGGGLIMMVVSIVIAVCLAVVFWIGTIPGKLRRLWTWMEMKPYRRKPVPPHQLN
jgi:hypothetical protein